MHKYLTREMSSVEIIICLARMKIKCFYRCINTVKPKRLDINFQTCKFRTTNFSLTVIHSSCTYYTKHTHCQIIIQMSYTRTLTYVHYTHMHAHTYPQISIWVLKTISNCLKQMNRVCKKQNFFFFISIRVNSLIN